MNETASPSAIAAPVFEPGQLVRVSRRLANGWTREYQGMLARELEVGAPLVLVLDSSRLITSDIRTLRREPDGSVVIETQHNPYTVYPLLVLAVDGRDVDVGMGLTKASN